METNTLLCQLPRSEAVTALTHALTSAGIPYRTQHHGESTTTFFVPVRHLDRARTIVDDNLVPVNGSPDFGDAMLEESTDDDRRRPVLAVPFPWRAVEWVIATIMFNTGLFFWASSTLPSGRAVWQYGTTAAGSPFEEPWRLLTALFLHANLGQVLGNGLALLVFAIPVIGWLGVGRTAAIYLSAGMSGGLVAVWLAPAGTVVLGSAGAVAGLFGAWLVLTLRRSRRQSLGWRPRVRSLGIAVLVLPGLLGLADDGRSGVRNAQVTGTLAGMVTGLVLALPTREERLAEIS